ncbi:MAG TPA: GTPase Era [Candidatus Fimihabitans intestinipullorum]|uniref:GTPase Era n=1 Tax=Candidatus Fimihabitans intestinipullorum TaxID=2840820 RepID=A0A9D1HWR9_9BACT|nr:GTPase Era [Candidatus Fimihabitans intestinipullorum]
MRSGFVSLIGRPNAGKSTLMNQFLKTKVAITSSKPQTTRNLIQGIYNDEDTQIVFIDTPGIHKPNHKLGKYLNEQAYYSLNDGDIILFLVDASEKLGAGDQYIIERLKSASKPVILVLNKIDKMKKEQILEKINEYKDLYPFAEIVPVSALKKDNVSHLLKVIKSYLPDSVKYYEDGQVTNKPIEFVMAEMVREKVFRFTEQEVPHSITCVVDSVEVGKTSYHVHVSIIVDRDSLKKIIIGSRGSMLKKIGTYARKDLENLLGKKVYLELFVKTIPKWRDKEKYLADFGFHEFE